MATHSNQNDRFAPSSPIPSAIQLPATHFLSLISEAMIHLVRRDGPDLTARQLSVFLTTYLEDRRHTIQGLAADLKIAKPAIGNVLDQLEAFDLTCRTVDRRDRRSILVGRTLRGAVFLSELQGTMAASVSAHPYASGDAANASSDEILPTG
jgi:DNA-binding MarR family transcriptional regulator